MFFLGLFVRKQLRSGSLEGGPNALAYANFVSVTMYGRTVPGYNYLFEVNGEEYGGRATIAPPCEISREVYDQIKGVRCPVIYVIDDPSNSDVITNAAAAEYYGVADSVEVDASTAHLFEPCD